MIITRAKATEARDELVHQVGFDRGPHKTGIVGIGIGRAKDTGYCLMVDVTDEHLDLPQVVHGVPVKLVLSPALPKAYRETVPLKASPPTYGIRRKLRRIGFGVEKST